MAYKRKNFDAYFFRTNDGHEIDLVLKFSNALWAFEFKLTSSPGAEDMKRLNATADLIRADKRFLISKSARRETGSRFVSTNMQHCLEIILNS